MTRLQHPLRQAILLAAVFFLLAGCGGGPTATPSNLSPLEQQGFQLFNLHCAPCHSTAPETVIVGPSLEGVATRAATRVEGQTTEEYLQRSILAPYEYLVDGYSETMPPDFGKRLSGEEFDAILAYLLTLK